jgi:hypothetical protein
MRDFIIIAVLCLAGAGVADAVWLNGKNVGAVKQELGVVWSMVYRR